MRRPAKYNRLLSSDLTLLVREWDLRGRPRQIGLDWPLQEWLDDFPEYESFLNELKSKNLGLLDRKLVKEVTRNSIHSNQFERGFLACMIWGFGNRGYAQHRTRKMLSSPNFGKSLQETVKLLNQGDLASAYRVLIEEGPEGLGCSFGSKYLYFAAPDDEEIQPIIVDAVIARAINELTMSSANSVRMNAEKYALLIEEFSQAAKELHLKSDILEEILFDAMMRKSNNTNWNSSEPSNLTEREKKSWVLSLIVDMIRKGESFNVERTHPGGGQYDCIGIKSFGNIEVDFNVRGSIHIFKPGPSHIDWESVLSLGLLEVSRRIRRSAKSRERAMPSSISDSYSWLSRALVGKAQITVEDFESFFMVTDQQKAMFDTIGKSATSKEIENSFILFVEGKPQAMLLPWKGLVLTLAGEEIKIESDCYMPVENYYGDE